MFLTLTEAAERLTVSVSTVRRLTQAGLLPIVRISPRRVAIPESAVKTYRGLGCQSNRIAGGMSSNSAKWASVYSSVCQRESRSSRRRNGKRRDAGKSSTGHLAVVKNLPLRER